VLTTPLFKLPVPSSRALVPTGYPYVLPDQDGWSRALHFQTAWVAVITGLLYLICGVFTGHFRKHLLPDKADLSRQALARVIGRHLRFEPPGEAEAWSYNVLQRLTYLFVIFVLSPLVVWTGLAMSPAFVSALPVTVTLLGGRQSARTRIYLLLSVPALVTLFPSRSCIRLERCTPCPFPQHAAKLLVARKAALRDPQLTRKLPRPRRSPWTCRRKPLAMLLGWHLASFVIKKRASVNCDSSPELPCLKCVHYRSRGLADRLKWSGPAAGSGEGIPGQCPSLVRESL